jgi:omega-6 fatty acid desaturase (delta-12 desaturase)
MDAGAVAEEKRAGAALVRATKPFSEEDPARTWRLFGSTLLVYAIFEAGALFLSRLGPAALPLQLASGAIAGLVIVRMFIFYHDFLHGAVFRESRLGKAIMHAYGIFIMSPAPVWEQTHDYHHRNNAKMLGASIGSYPVVTVRMWHSLNANQRWWYKFARNPLTMLFGYFTIFIGGMCTAAFLRDPKQHWQGPLSVVLHLATLVLVWALLGWQSALAGVFFPQFVSAATGSYLFYAQHNFPAAELRSRDAWTYHHAALRASSMMDMPALMHWFTGNIGYHHVHHLNHKIPFYLLPDAMAAIPELQTPGRTSWHPRDILACLRLALWDPDRNRFISWSELPQPQAVGTTADGVGGA